MPAYLQWIILAAFVVGALFVDLFLLNRKAHEVKLKEALLTSSLWISLALIFNVIVYFWRGGSDAALFFTAYLVEESLSVDNLFVFIIIFKFFKVPPKFQHRVLFWGIIGAVVMRGVFITIGVVLIHQFSWIIYVFGAFLIYTAAKMAFGKEAEFNPEKNFVTRLFSKRVDNTAENEKGHFFIKKAGKVFATPLFLALAVVEASDLVFALDSIPAVLAITSDPFIVYSSNIFAILGLRSLYFALAHVMGLFAYLHYGLAIVLAFIGVKMIISHHVEIPIFVALGAVGGTLAGSIVLSLIFPPKAGKE